MIQSFHELKAQRARFHLPYLISRTKFVALFVVFLSVLTTKFVGFVLRNMTARFVARTTQKKRKLCYILYKAFVWLKTERHRHKGYFSWKHFLVAVKFNVNNLSNSEYAMPCRQDRLPTLCTSFLLLSGFASPYYWIPGDTTVNRETKRDFPVSFFHCVNIWICWVDNWNGHNEKKSIVWDFLLQFDSM